jgi:hypothetical protein
MALQSPSPFVYLFPGLLLAAVVLYFAYGVIDRAGLSAYTADGEVLDRQYAPGSTTYTTEVIGGRTMTRANRNPEAYMVSLRVSGEATGAVVDRALYESLQPGDRVHVTVRRTRLSKRLLVTSVSR